MERLHEVVGSFASRSAAARAIRRSEGVLRTWLCGRSEPLAQRMMDMEVESLCAVGYGERSPERVNSPNGYRER